MCIFVIRNAVDVESNCNYLRLMYFINPIEGGAFHNTAKFDGIFLYN